MDFSLEPFSLKKEQALEIEKTFTSLLKEVEDFTNKALKDKKLLKSLNVPEDIAPEPTPLGLHIPFARFDFLYDGKDITALELNTDGTSGFNVVEWLGHEARLKSEEDPNFNLSYRLLEAVREHKPDAKDLALVDLPGIMTSWEQHDLINQWKSIKAPCHFADPTIRSWKDGSLIYRRILSWQLRAQPEKFKAFLSDWKEKKITVVGGWSSDVGMSKAWPAFLKPKIFPETILLTEESAKKITDEKDFWIIKGALSYSGQANFRGVDLNQMRWASCVSQALRETVQGRHWIAQRRVEVPRVDGKPIELGIYFLNGKPSGYLCRWGSLKSISETSDEIYRPVKITS